MFRVRKSHFHLWQQPVFLQHGLFSDSATWVVH
jgi:hypothetical protein